MNRKSAFFLKTVVVFIAIGVLALMIRFPLTEGRAANLDVISIYTDPIIIYMYIASIPFFVGLYHALRLLDLIVANKALSKSAVYTLRSMKYASFSLICFILLGLTYIRFIVHGEDTAGPTMLGFIMVITFGVIATATGMLQKIFQHAVDIKSENDLTV